MRLRRKAGRTPPPTGGYVGDHADRLRRVKPMAHDDDERPRREDMDYGRTIFDGSWWSETVPRFLRGRRKREP